MKRFALCIVFVLTFSFSAYGVETIPANDPNIQYIGRIDFTDPLAPILWWPGSYIIANFEGTSINVKLNDYNSNGKANNNNYFYVIIDDGEPSLIPLSPGEATYVAATGLTDTVHKIQLFKRTETTEGEVAFTGFELDDGKGLLLPPARPKRRIEYYGNSITAGHSVAVPIGLPDTNDGWGKDNYYTYGSVTARNLDAEYHCIAVSGIGLYIDKWGFGGNMQTLYYDKQSSSTTWDFNQWTPQIVLINLGQNDKWGAYTQEGMESNYVNFAQTLRGHYPDAHIIIALGDMDATAPGSPFPGYVKNAVAELNTTYNDTKVYSLIFPYGGSSHPRIERNAAMADQLTAFIQNNIPGFGSHPDTNNDDYINNIDFAEIASEWLEIDCGPCNGKDITEDGNVNMDDLLVIADLWLTDLAFEGHWKFDGDATDSSYSGNDGTPYGGVSWGSGIMDGAIELNGIDGYVEITGYKGITGSDSRTVAAWIKTENFGQIISWGNYLDSGGKWLFRVQDLPSGTVGAVRIEVNNGYIIGNTDVRDNQWHHVAAVLADDGSANVGEVDLYVDGIPESISSVLTGAINTGQTNDVRIGVFADYPQYFNGLIDDVRIYNRPLSEAEIQALAEMGS